MKSPVAPVIGSKNVWIQVEQLYHGQHAICLSCAKSSSEHKKKLERKQLATIFPFEKEEKKMDRLLKLVFPLSQIGRHESLSPLFSISISMHVTSLLLSLPL